ncbi:MAG TPA: alanine--glyoxylate aminotransferase family protein [Gemmatimonadales bacterium]|nr:alanine--glyoxylate aminotransferase family protein [Gemmatimonadales bacterium]
MTLATPAFGKFFLPGPTDVHPDVLAAMYRPMIGHRSSAMEELLKRAAPRLQQLARTSRTVMVGTTSATGFMEMAVRSGIRKKAISIVNGSFSERFAELVSACDKECVRLEVPLGGFVEPDQLRDALRKNPGVDAVTLAHSETSTGVLQDVAALSKVVHEFPDVLFLVDAVTSMAGSPVETDAWDLDYVFTGSQKALALPPGLAFGVASPRMIERAKSLPSRGLYFDLITFEKASAKYQPTNTPALSLFFALDVQLARIEAAGGIEARWKRHDDMRKATEQWVRKVGLSYLPPEGRRSWTVSCIKMPAGKVSKDLVAAVKKEGWVIGTGYGGVKDSTFRIGHMGDHTVASLENLLALIERTLA